MGNILLTNIKVTSGIHEDDIEYANKELYNLAKNKNFSIPDGYALAQIDKKMLMNDFNKFVKDRPWNPDPVAWERSQMITTEQCAPYMKGTVLSYKAAKERAEKGKATGYPFDRIFKSKGAVYNHPLADKILWKIIYYIMTNPGKLVRVYHKTSPKVEVRPLNKLMSANPKQRVFMCCEMIFYTIGIMLYGDQNDSFLKAWSTHNYSAVGVSLQYGMWHVLYTLLTDGLPLEEALKLIFYSYDISGMEATIRFQVFMAIYKMRFANLVIPKEVLYYYTNLHNWFLATLCTAFVIDPHGFLIIMFGGNPSGGFNTLTDNGYAQMLYKNYSFAKHFNTYEELRMFVQTVRIKMVGDDSIEKKHHLVEFYKDDVADLGVDTDLECAPGKITLQTFLNFSWFWDRKHCIMVPKANLDKMLANVFYYRKKNSWRLTYVKLQAIRFFTQVYPDIDYQIKYYIKYIEDHHMEDMKNEKIDDVITLHATLQQNMSEDRLKFLMYGISAEILGY